MNNRRFLLALALGLILTLLFIVPATAGSVLECKGELQGGYSFTGPEEVTVSIDVRNAGDEDFPGPVELYYPDLTQVTDFGSPTLAAGSGKNWEGTWKITQKELEEGLIAFYVRYPVKDEATGMTAYPDAKTIGDVTNILLSLGVSMAELRDEDSILKAAGDMKLYFPNYEG